jgi:hypothetical protein
MNAEDPTNYPLDCDSWMSGRVPQTMRREVMNNSMCLLQKGG